MDENLQFVHKAADEMLEEMSYKRWRDEIKVPLRYTCLYWICAEICSIL